MCKKCITMNVDNEDPSTYLWILKECDVPYIPEVWNDLWIKYGKDRSKVSGLTIIGRYLGIMKLKQNKDYRWDDTEHLREASDLKIKEAMLRQGYSMTEVDQVISSKNGISFTEEDVQMPAAASFDSSFSEDAEDFWTMDEDYFDRDNSSTTDLTDEDKIYLRLKWGKAYKPEEWVKLEQLYQEMQQSYDIQGAGHEDTLKLVCKTSLKANQLLDIGDVDGAQKMIKMYDGLMKSGNFTAAQNKAESGEFVDSVGELIEMCEKQGYIERFYIESPNDKVDFTINDMQRYTRTLIEGETNLSNMIEAAIKQNQKEDADRAASEEEDIVDDIDMSIEDIEKSLKDSDFEDFNDFLEEEEMSDDDFFNSLMEGGTF